MRRSLVLFVGALLLPLAWVGHAVAESSTLLLTGLMEIERPRPPQPEDGSTPFAIGRPVHEAPEWSKGRMAIWSGANATVGYMAYRQSQASWGASNGQFHFKDDLHDGLAMSDEASHLFAAYHLTRALHSGYVWTGMSPTTARQLAAAHAWLWTFFIEYPIDAYNPTQGFGVSDLVFNTIGVAAAWHHSAPGLPRWDIKISVKPSFFKGSSRVIASSNEQYDDYIYWVTVRPSQSRYIPVWLGTGYSTTHHADRIDREVHVGVGTTIDALAGVFDPTVARYLRPLNFFFLNLNTKAVF